MSEQRELPHAVSPTCASCGSANIQRYRMVWEAGTASIEATSVGLGRGLFVAGSSGTQTSMLARRVAPPEPASTGFALAVVTIGVVIAITGSPIFGGSL